MRDVLNPAATDDDTTRSLDVRPTSAHADDALAIPRVARLWHGVTLVERADEYRAFLQARAVPEYRATPGNVSVDILQRTAGYVTHFLVLTRWTSREAIAGFAGEDIDAPRYYPEDRDFLLEFEARVEHYDLAAA